MIDRETLTAALDAFYATGEPLPEPEVYVAAYRTIAIAARERLAQLPEKCEHGELEPHAEEHWSGPLTGAGYSCLGRVYPAELVERIAKVLNQVTHGNINAALTENRYPVIAAAILDALNGETT